MHFGCTARPAEASEWQIQRSESRRVSAAGVLGHGPSDESGSLTDAAIYHPTRGQQHEATRGLFQLHYQQINARFSGGPQSE